MGFLSKNILYKLFSSSILMWLIFTSLTGSKILGRRQF
uniref:Uncharacterized protein n=1 Tax=Arundo donax TaxID=35708 RepID=A0A0A8YI34_ARUDO